MFRRVISTTLVAIILALCFSSCTKKPVDKKAEETKTPENKGDAVLSIIPADSIFCVRINNLNQTTGNLDQYIMGVSPMPVSTAGLIKGQLGTMFGNPELKGFDVNGSFAAFAFLAPAAMCFGLKEDYSSWSLSWRSFRRYSFSRRVASISNNRYLMQTRR